MSRATNITVLVDNQADPGLCSEHGLSLWIQSGGQHILFDTGQADALKANAELLGVDLSKTDRLVLSHGHYDHTGGIAHVLQAAPNALVYAHPGILDVRYSLRDGVARSVSIPDESKTSLLNLADHRLLWVTQAMPLLPGVELTGPIPRETNFEDTGGPFYLDPQGERPDLLMDDLALWINTSMGAVVCVGCCHAGLINTLTHIQHLENNPIRAIIGGLHLLQASEERLHRTISALRAMVPHQVVPCHCTGGEAIKALQAAFPGRVLPGRAGMELCFE